MNQPAANQPLPAPIIWGETNVGKQRSHNEDQIYPDMRHKTSLRPPTPQAVQARGYLMVVADGIGGAQVGDTAANFAVRSAVDHYYNDPRPLSLDKLLQSAVEIANTNVYNYVKTSPAIQQAGCTLTAAAIRGNELVVAHVGDSRAYLVQDGIIYPVTTDHNVAHLMASGQPLPGGGQGLAGNMLVRSLGAGPAVEVETRRFLLKPGDTVLVCSDGLHGVVSNDEIKQISGRETPEKGARKLIDLANARGGPDNISVIIARMPGAAAAPAGAAARSPKRLTALAIAALALVGVLAVLLFAIDRLGNGREMATTAPTVAVAAATASPAAIAAAPTETAPATDIPAATTSLPATPAPTDTATGTSGSARPPTSTPAIPDTPTPLPTSTPRPAQPTASPVSIPSSSPAPSVGAPQLSGPPNGSEQRNQVLLQWTHGGLRSGQQYRINLRTENQQDPQDYYLTSVDTSLQIHYDQYPAFFKDDRTTFFWSVVVINSSGNVASGWSEKWHFVMRRDLPPPALPTQPLQTPEPPTPEPPTPEPPTPEPPTPTPTPRS